MRIEVAGDATAWGAAGFRVDDNVVQAGQTRIEIGVGERGIASADYFAEGGTQSEQHPNGVTLLDHLVVFTDDPDRTTAQYGALGLDARRVRELGNGTTQTFFKAGEVIIELVGPIPDVKGERLWGFAFTTADLDACAKLLGGALGTVKNAVQPGRRIATLRHKDVGLTVPIAFMSP